ncbi:MAG TPA: F0F1 ATP synthase subunit epsilon [Desulfitobacteriaceae bacterium]|nr:F0F1 ATP synthase subunit epsilon [Desulfitobacteriaceae bacterium]
MTATAMTLKIVLPYQIFAVKTGVTRIVAETGSGSFGIWPQRLDCVAALEPGILTYENDTEGEAFIAVDTGILVKTGFNILVSVRNASGGVTLEQLHEAVEREFVELNEREKNIHTTLKKMESNFINRLVRYYHGK